MKYLFVFAFTVFFSAHLFGQEVILIRHAEVQLDYAGWISSKKAVTLRQKYDTAPVHQFNPDTVLSKIPKLTTDTIYVSGLPRSIATGLKLFGNSSEIMSLEILNEFEMHIIWLPVHLPYKGWTTLSRGMWLLGLKKNGTESYKEAKERVKIVANFIEKKAAIQKQFIMVTHGFINRNVAKELEDRGWTITQNEGKKNLGATVLNKY